MAFDLVAWGDRLLVGSFGLDLRHDLTRANPYQLRSPVLVGPAGPADTNDLRLTRQLSGPDWKYLQLDLTSAFAGRLDRFRRDLLLIEPDLIVIHDELAGREPADVQFSLSAPGPFQFDHAWEYLRLQSPRAGLTAAALCTLPRTIRTAQPVEDSPAHPIPLPHALITIPKATGEVHLITVLLVEKNGDKKSMATKLLQSDTAVGARIHRQGLPTLVAFRRQSAQGAASLTGLEFDRPVAVEVFRPKPRPNHRN